MRQAEWYHVYKMKLHYESLACKAKLQTQRLCGFSANGSICTERRGLNVLDH